MLTLPQRDARFLVKGGEDLRLDQRVQLMFNVMNRVLASSPQCVTRALRLRTYSVIPLNDQVGLIEWVDGTLPLKQVIEEQVPGKAMESAYRAFQKSFPSNEAYITKFRSSSEAAIKVHFDEAQVLRLRCQNTWHCVYRRREEAVVPQFVLPQTCLTLCCHTDVVTFVS